MLWECFRFGLFSKGSCYKNQERKVVVGQIYLSKPRFLFLAAWTVNHWHELPRESLDFPSGDDV